MRAREIEIRYVRTTDGEQRVVLHAPNCRPDEFACRLYHRSDTTRRRPSYEYGPAGNIEFLVQLGPGAANGADLGAAVAEGVATRS